MRLMHAERQVAGRDLFKVDRGNLWINRHMKKGVILTVVHMHASP